MTSESDLSRQLSWALASAGTANTPSAREAATSSTWAWATVTQALPLRIRMDGDAAALPATPSLLCPTPPVGARVWVQIHGTALIIHGSSAAQVQQPFAMAAGQVAFPPMSNVSNWSRTGITLPSGRFTVPPLVITGIASANGSSNTFTTRAVVDSTTGGYIYLYPVTGTITITANLYVNWYAVQMRPGSAAG